MPQWLSELGGFLSDKGNVALLMVVAATGGSLIREFRKNMKSEAAKATEEAPIVAPPSHAAKTQMLVGADRMTLELVLESVATLGAKLDRVSLLLEARAELEEERALEERLLQRLKDTMKPVG